MRSLQPLRYAAADLTVAAVRRSSAAELIASDASAFVELRELDVPARAGAQAHLVVGYPEFRNVLFYRLQRAGQGALAAALRRLWPPMPLLEIGCPSIGPGFVISHGHGTVISARAIGRRLWVHHQVTIGWTYGHGAGMPTIGDDVFVGAGAKILGPVRVGDGARIGANAVVLRDVPDGATAVGVPAEVIERRGSPGSGRS